MHAYFFVRNKMKHVGICLCTLIITTNPKPIFCNNSPLLYLGNWSTWVFVWNKFGFVSTLMQCAFLTNYKAYLRKAWGLGKCEMHMGCPLIIKGFHKTLHLRRSHENPLLVKTLRNLSYLSQWLIYTFMYFEILYFY